MKALPTIIALQFALLAFSFGEAEPAAPATRDSEVAKAPEYIAARAAEKHQDGATMLAQSKILLARFPNSALVHKAMADAYFYMNFLDEAVASAEKAIQISPKDPTAWLDLAHIRMTQEKPEEAETALKGAVNAAKDDPTPWAHLAAFYGDRGNTAYAVECANYAAKLLISNKFDDHNGETPEAFTWRAIAAAFQTINRPGDAIPYLKRAIVLQPDESAFWLALATSYSQHGDRGNAIAAAQQALKLAPDSNAAKLTLQTLTAPPPQRQAQQLPAQQPLTQQPTLEQLRQIVELTKALEDLDAAGSRKSSSTASRPTQYNGRPLPPNWIDPKQADTNFFLQQLQNQRR